MYMQYIECRGSEDAFKYSVKAGDDFLSPSLGARRAQTALFGEIHPLQEPSIGGAGAPRFLHFSALSLIAHYNATKRDKVQVFFFTVEFAKPGH